MISENVRENLRRRLKTIEVQMDLMESKDQQWKGRYHELKGEQMVIQDMLEGNYD